jgi:hypothetical protein
MRYKELTPEQRERAQFIIGQRVYCGLYGGKYGIIFEIRGEQTPDTVRTLGRGVICTGGSADFNIVFDDGHCSFIPESLLRSSCQWRVYESIATAEDIALAIAFCATEKIRRDAEESEKSKERAKRREQAIATYTYLERVAPGQYASAKQGARNIRIELKRAFPGIKFSVTSDHSSISIGWSLGPTTKEVEAITSKYQSGSFNGMEDIYEGRSGRHLDRLVRRRQICKRKPRRKPRARNRRRSSVPPLRAPHSRGQIILARPD